MDATSDHCQNSVLKKESRLTLVPFCTSRLFGHQILSGLTTTTPTTNKNNYTSNQSQTTQKSIGPIKLKRYIADTIAGKRVQADYDWLWLYVLIGLKSGVDFLNQSCSIVMD